MAEKKTPAKKTTTKKVTPPAEAKAAETKIINKLELRNIKDLKFYIDDFLENCFIDYEKNSFILNDKKIIIKDI